MGSEAKSLPESGDNCPIYVSAGGATVLSAIEIRTSTGKIASNLLKQKGWLPGMGSKLQ
jgi:hypothetical protein